MLNGFAPVALVSLFGARNCLRVARQNAPLTVHGEPDAPVVARYYGDKLFDGSHSSPVEAR